MEERPGGPWHRDGLPAWAWTFLTVSRLVALLAALIPLALAVGVWWWWNHPPGHGRAVLARMRTPAAAAVDTLVISADSLAARIRRR